MQFSSTLVHHKIASRYSRHNAKIKCTLKAVSSYKSPAVRSYLIGVEPPELQFLLVQRTTHVGRVVQLPGAIVVEDLREDARVPVEKILVEDRVVIGQRLREPRQPGGRNLLQRRLVRLVAKTTHVEHDALGGVRRRHCSLLYRVAPQKSKPLSRIIIKSC